MYRYMASRFTEVRRCASVLLKVGGGTRIVYRYGAVIPLAIKQSLLFLGNNRHEQRTNDASRRYPRYENNTAGTKASFF